MALGEDVFNATDWAALFQDDRDEYNRLFDLCSPRQKGTAKARTAGKKKSEGWTPARRFSAQFTREDWSVIDSPFDENRQAVEDQSPQYWFNYFFKEAKKYAIQEGDAGIG